MCISMVRSLSFLIELYFNLNPHPRLELHRNPIIPHDNLLKPPPCRRGLSAVKHKKIIPTETSRDLHGGEEGIRTLVGLPPNGFQDRLVMTTSIPLRIVL